MKLQLIEKWQRAHTLYSIQLAALIMLLAALQAEVLPRFEATLDPTVYAVVNGLLALVLALVRLVRQGPPVDTDEGDQ